MPGHLNQTPGRADIPLVSEPGAAPLTRGNGTSPLEAPDSVFSPQEINLFSALLWGIGCLIGVLAIALPHGPNVAVAGWGGVTAFAGIVALWSLWKGAELPMWTNYVLSLLALTAVNMALVFAHHTALVFAASALFVLPTIFTASFYQRTAFLAYLVVQAATSAAVLFTSGIPGAPAGWALMMGTTTTLGIVMHVLHEALSRAAVTDPLTGLANRRALEPVLGRELARCARLGHPLSLAVMDLDHFKDVNDAFGHQHGDRLLAEVSRAWCTHLRESDVLARAGGDEFVLLLPSTGVGQALAVLNRLGRATPQAFSAGVALATRGCTVEDVLREADDACYQAKQRGGGRVVVSQATAA
jgi:diguanylate cyclase (GGDEF)-like protein